MSDNNNNIYNVPENDAKDYANLMNTLINEMDKGKPTNLKDKIMVNTMKKVGKASIKANTAYDFYNDYMNSSNPDRKDLSMDDVLNHISNSKGGFQKAFKVLVIGVIVVLALLVLIIFGLIKFGTGM